MWCAAFLLFLIVGNEKRGGTPGPARSPLREKAERGVLHSLQERSRRGQTYLLHGPACPPQARGMACADRQGFACGRNLGQLPVLS